METPLPESLLVPRCGPRMLPGGKTGCLLVHGFTAMPAETGHLAAHLNQQGYTVLSVRLAGHASHPADLLRTRWSDWLLSVEEYLSILNGLCSQVFVIGQSLGGALTLLAAARYPLAGAVAISTPAGGRRPSLDLRLAVLSRVMIRKKVSTAPPPLDERIEASYPAYPSVPAPAILQAQRCFTVMQAALPQVKVPVLLISSTTDPGVPPATTHLLYSLLGTTFRRMHILENMDHSILQDPRRTEAFTLISTFLTDVLAGHES